MNKKQFEQLQKDNIMNREKFLNVFPGDKEKMESHLIKKEKIYGLLLGVASINLPDKRFCMVEKYEKFYFINFGSGEETKNVLLSYEGFYAFGLLWNGFRTDEDSKRFFELLEKTDNT